ncbi:uncharacterized protein LOC108624570 [Ceratina calcarata]|uniref:Uncharacterized protein LOC108624570 n=1 Tax=Ceratina calcarata TaxID=156304 RepID=A0AAJ7IYE7_9HYME|nr:uncharacterized protein LOC108624570 [Ceratina calcarata]
MGSNNLCLFLVICATFLSVDKVTGYDIAPAVEDKAECFLYRWVAWDNIDKTNCTGRKNVPCIEPLINSTDTLPNSTDLWVNRDKNPENYFCTGEAGNSCVKYTYFYDNNVVNTSSFCGKVIEDNSVPVVSGCYQQNVNGFVIEVCVCPPRLNQEPCNTSPDIKYSISLIALTVLFMLVSYV